MISALCVLLSGVCFYFSLALGEQWALAWLAPIPVLWLAFGETPLWRVFLLAFAAYAIGGANLAVAYAGIMPPPVLVLAIAGPALLFALAVAGARFANKRLGALIGALVFAALWAGLDFASSFSAAGGSALTPAASQIGAPMLAQSASLFGFSGITFLLGAVAAGLAAALRTRDAIPAILALGLFAANAGFGAWRMSSPSQDTMRVALIASDEATAPFMQTDESAARRVLSAYAAQIDQLQQTDLIVLPENLARLDPAWRDAALAPLAEAAARKGATVVVGFNTLFEGAQRNVAWAATPNSAPVVYSKRRLVVGLETPAYTPGRGSRALDNGIGLAICKDMDFAHMIRADVALRQPILLAVPAWDFGADRWSHARVAILRSIENGVPMARSARDGLLTLNDRYGRVIARAQTNAGFTTLVDDVPVQRAGARTLYTRIGDAFGWLCLTLGLGLIGVAFAARRASAA